METSRSSTGSRIVAVPDQVFCDLAGESAILDLKSGIYYGLNPVGTHIWKLIQSPRTLEEIVSSVVADFDVDRARCEADLHTLLGKLRERGLIEEAA